MTKKINRENRGKIRTQFWIKWHRDKKTTATWWYGNLQHTIFESPRAAKRAIDYLGSLSLRIARSLAFTSVLQPPLTPWSTDSHQYHESTPFLSMYPTYNGMLPWNERQQMRPTQIQKRYMDETKRTRRSGVSRPAGQRESRFIKRFTICRTHYFTSKTSYASCFPSWMGHPLWSFQRQVSPPNWSAAP